MGRLISTGLKFYRQDAKTQNTGINNKLSGVLAVTSTFQTTPKGGDWILTTKICIYLHIYLFPEVIFPFFLKKDKTSSVCEFQKV